MIATTLRDLRGKVFKVGTPQRASGFVQPDYGRIHQELRRKGMTLMLLWEEHTVQHPGEATHRYLR